MSKLHLFFTALLCSFLVHNSYAQDTPSTENDVLQTVYYGNADLQKGVELHIQGNYPEARLYLQKAYNALKAERNWEAVIKTADKLSGTYIGSDNYEPGIAIIDNLLEIIAKEAPAYVNRCALIYLSKAYIYINGSEFQKGFNNLYQASNVNRKLQQPDSTVMIKIYNVLSFMHQQLGDIDSAHIYIQQSIDIINRLEAPMVELVARSFFFLGDITARRGNYGKAINEYEQGLEYALEIYGNNNIELCKYYGRISTCYQSLEEYEKAGEYGKKSLYIYENKEDLSDDIYRYIIPSFHLTNCFSYLQIHELEEAIFHYEQALKYKEKYEEDLDSNTIMLRLWGHILLAQDKPREALKYHIQAKDVNTIFRNSNKDYTYNYDIQIVNHYTDIARCYHELGILDSALLANKEAIRIIENISDYNSGKMQFGIYHRLANTYIEQQELDSALVYNQKSLLNTCQDYNTNDLYALPASRFFKNTTDSYIVLRQKATILHQKAIQASAKAEQQMWLDKTLSCLVLSDELHIINLKKANLYNVPQSINLINNSTINYKMGLDIIQQYYAVAPEQNLLDMSFYFTQKMKAQELWMSLLNSKSRDVAGLDKTLLDQERDLLSEIAYYENKVRDANANSDTSAIKKYNNEFLFEKKKALAKLYRQLETDYPDYYEAKYAFIPEDENSLKRILKDDEALIEYVLMDSLLYTFVVTADKRLKIHQTPLKEDFADQVNQLNKLLQNSAMMRKSSRLRFIDLSHQLYQTLIQPVIADLQGKSRLIIIGDGLTNYIPFEVLISSNTPNTFDQLPYLIKDHEISYHYSATLFAKARKNEPTIENTLYAFAPVYDTDAYNTDASLNINKLRAFDEDGTLTPLPESEKEINGIVQLFPQNDIEQPTISLRQKATEADLKHQLEQPYRFIHIAGHSFADLESPNFSGVACYSDNASTEEDGILYTGEIYALSTNADLITLSSCESGYGQLKGSEGILGLNRAFIYAGAQNVTYSLWKVYDKISAQLMIDFYKHILEGKSYALSLRKAKLKLLENEATASPHFWGPYLLIGR